MSTEFVMVFVRLASPAPQPPLFDLSTPLHWHSSEWEMKRNEIQQQAEEESPFITLFNVQLRKPETSTYLTNLRSGLKSRWQIGINDLHHPGTLLKLRRLDDTDLVHTDILEILSRDNSLDRATTHLCCCRSTNQLTFYESITKSFDLMTQQGWALRPNTCHYDEATTQQFSCNHVSKSRTENHRFEAFICLSQ